MFTPMFAPYLRPRLNPFYVHFKCLKYTLKRCKMSEKVDKTRVSLTLTRPYIQGLDTLVATGYFIDPQDAIREFIRDGFRKHGIDPFKRDVP